MTNGTGRPIAHAVPAWQHDATCQNEDPEMFFPVSPNAPAQDAKRVCAACPVREQCLQWAVDTGQASGVWGGLTEIERRELRFETDVRRPRAGLAHMEKDEALEAIRVAVRGGATYLELDQRWGLARNSVSQFVSRARTRAKKSGEAFDELPWQKQRPNYKEKEVAAIRLRSQRGESDLTIAMSLGVSRNTITCVVNGSTYRKFGGPIRPKRVNKPNEASRTLWAHSSPVAPSSAALAS